MGDLDLEGRISFRDESAAAFASATGHIEHFGSEVAGEMAKLAAEILTVEKAIEFLVEGIKKADEIRDLALSLNVFTGSVEKGAAAFKFFEEEARNTRDTADDLARLFRDTLPLAISRGFSQESMQHVTIWLSQLGTIAGKSAEEMQSGFQQLLSGRVSAGRNPLLKVLGITKADVKDLGWDEIVTKMEEVSGHFSEFGQSWDSTMKKAKDSLLDAFGEGWNSARGETLKGTAAIEATVKELVPILRDLGKTFAEWVPTIVRAFEGAGGALRVFFGGVETAAGLTLSAVADAILHITEIIGKALAKTLDDIVAFQAGMPDWAWVVLKVTNPAIDASVASMISASQKITAGVESTKAAMLAVEGVGSGMMTNGAEQVRAGIEMVTNAQKPLAAATAETKKETSGLTDEMKKLLGSLGKVAIDTTGAGKAQQELAKLTASIHGQIMVLDAQIGKLQTANPIYELFAQEQVALAEASKRQATELEKLREVYGKLGDSPEIRAVLHLLDEQYDKEAKLADLQFNRKLDDQFKQGYFYQELYKPNMPGAPLNAQQQGQLEFIDWQTQAKVFAKYLVDEQIGKRMADQFRSSMSSALSDFIQTGGKNFGQIAGQYLSAGIQEGVDRLMASVFGRPGDSNLMDAAGRPQDPSRFYGAPDASGRAAEVSATRNKVGQEALTGASIAYGGYQAGLSGQSGARTGAVVSGAAAGFEVAGVYGAIVGAALGAIAGAIGAAQKQSEYKYGVPSIIGGEASFTGAKNIQQAQQDQMRQQLQEAYDSMRDQLVNVFIKIPGAVLSKAGNMGGAFQPEPSAHFMEHWQQFIDQTLPKEQLAEVGKDVGVVAESLGMSTGRFAEIWKHLEGIDPKKVPAILDQLFTSLRDLQKIQTYWSGGDLAHATSPISNDKLDFANNALWFGDAQRLKGMAAAFAEGDASIVQLATHIKDLSPEGQIAAFQQLTGLMKQRDDMLRQAAIELYNLAKSTKDELRSDKETLDVQRLRTATGEPDQYAISQYYKKKAEQDLFAIAGAANPAEAKAAFEQMRKDVMAAEAAGLAQADEDQKNVWIDWAEKFLGLGGKQIDAAVARFGSSIDDINKAFNSQVDPAIASFTNVITDTSDKIGGVGDDLDKIRVPIRDVGVGMNGLVGDIANVRAEVVAFGEYLKSISAGKNDTADATVDARVA